MDLSSMIFVAVAVAWALYLIPMFRRDDEASKSRSVDRFSDTMRVLAGREAPGGAAKAPEGHGSQVSQAPAAEPPSQAQIAARRAATRKATERRRRVLMVLAGLNVVVAALAAAGVVGWVWQSVPVGLVVVWLVLCRVMVKGERAVTRSMFDPVASPAAPVDDDLPAEYDVARNEQGFDEVAPEAETTTIPRITEELWDPVPVTLPTYVGKEKAVRRTVRTIDLGGPGAWTSGHDVEDTEIAREAEVAAAIAREEEPEQDQRRAVGE